MRKIYPREFLLVILSLVLILGAFVFGVYVGSQEARSQDSNALLAYEHYYEVTDCILSLTDTLSVEDSIALNNELLLALNEIDSAKANYPMHFPKIVEQRDQLSDAIRCYYDNHPESDILEYVDNFVINPQLDKWVYSY